MQRSMAKCIQHSMHTHTYVQVVMLFRLKRIHISPFCVTPKEIGRAHV